MLQIQGHIIILCNCMPEEFENNHPDIAFIPDENRSYKIVKGMLGIPELPNPPAQ